MSIASERWKSRSEYVATPSLIPHGSASITAEAVSTPNAVRPATPAAAPRNPRRDVSICMDPLLFAKRTFYPVTHLCATSHVTWDTRDAVAFRMLYLQCGTRKGFCIWEKIRPFLAFIRTASQ